MPIALFAELIEKMEEEAKNYENDRKSSSRNSFKGIATMLPPEALDSRFPGMSWLKEEDHVECERNLKRRASSVEETGSVFVKRQALSSDEEQDESDDHHLPPTFDTLSSSVDDSVRRSAWGTPRGRRTIQDKIAEQMERAAEFERELKRVGVPTPSSQDTLPSPSLSQLGKPGYHRKQTVPISVIRKSPPVRNQLPQTEQPISPLDFVKHFNRNIMFIPSVIFRMDGVHAGDQLYIPQPIDNFILPPVNSPSLSDDHFRQSSPEATNKPHREERLSSKLKRIKAKSGDGGEESPRGFLSQKIETLKRRESHLQQEFEDALNAPITPSGISSARMLQQRNSLLSPSRAAQGHVLFQMYHAANNSGLPR